MRPDHLLEVLGLGNLPTDTTGPRGPVFLVGAERYELNFLDRDDAGQLYHNKFITIDRRPPFLVRSIVYCHLASHENRPAQNYVRALALNRLNYYTC